MRLLMFNLATDADDPLLGFTTRWIQAIAARVEFVHVITMRAGRFDLPENVRVHSVGKESGYSKPRRALEFYRHLRNVIVQGRIDACFSHMIPIFSLLAAPWLKLRKIPIVTWFAHPSVTSTLRLAHLLSDRMVASLPTAYPYRKDKLIVIGQGIDTDLFCPAPADQQEPPIILCVGRLSAVKDHPTLLRAAALLQGRFQRPFRLALVGGPASPADEEYARSLHTQGGELGLSTILDFVPPCPQTALLDWYRRSTIHVNLTPLGFGDKVTWEAMACATLCFASNDGYSETMGRWSDRLLFRQGDAEDLAARLAWALELSDIRRQQIGSNLRSAVLQQHSLTGLAGRLVTVLESECMRLNGS